MKRVFRAQSLIQVAHARNVLTMAGIDSQLRNEYLSGAMGDLPLLETWPQLWVEDEDESAAFTALRRATHEVGREPWRCSACGETLESQFTHCWRCSTPRGA